MASKGKTAQKKSSTPTPTGPVVTTYELWLDGVRPVRASAVRFPDKREVFFRKRYDRATAIRLAEEQVKLDDRKA